MKIFQLISETIRSLDIMAAHVLLLFLFLCQMERSGVSEAAGLSEDDEGFPVKLTQRQHVSPQPDFMDILLVRIKEPGSRGQEAGGNVITPTDVALQQSDRKPRDLGWSDSNRPTDTLSQHESSTVSKWGPQVTMSHNKRNKRTNEEDGGVINSQGLMLRSEGGQFGLHVDHGHIQRTGGQPRPRRSWLWNQFFVIEEYQGPEPVLIGRLHTDMDRGDGRTKYLLEGEGVSSVFVIDSNTGNIHVTKSLDREEKDRYHLTATAVDRETGQALEPSSEFIIRVQDINDNPPVFPDGPYVAMVPEMSNIGTSVIQVTAVDADDPTYGNSARLVYGITQGQDRFSVDPQTGIIRTVVPDMDRETQDEYLVILQAKDMGGNLGGLSGTTTVTVRLSDVNDNPPRFRRSAWSFSVSELAAPGVEVGRLTASDPDLGRNAQLEFSILDKEEANMFNITGRNREAVIVLNKLLDYESRNSYTFSVEVVNSFLDPRYLSKGPFKDQATIRVMILNADEPPQFSQALYHMDVSENCPPTCSVGRVYALDPDTGQSTNIRYSIDPQSDPEAFFRISSDSGLISAVMELDREQEQWHNITVIATQRDNPNLVSRAVVTIETLDQNDNAPELDREYTTSVCDSEAPGQVVQVLRAIDRDQEEQDSSIHFSIPPESSLALNLSIRDTGGVTASLVLQSALEPLPGLSSSLLTLYVPVVLRDGASDLTNTATVTVTVCPCLQGGMQTEDRSRQRDPKWERQVVCLPAPNAPPSLIFSLVTLLAMMAAVSTMLVVCVLSLSLRHQKRDSHAALEDDDVRENIISYNDEGGGEADTAAFDITTLQNMHRIQHVLSNGNIWCSHQYPPRARTYSWSRPPQPSLGPQPRPGSAPLYGRLCFRFQTLPVFTDYLATPQETSLGLTQLTQELKGRHTGRALPIQNQDQITSQPLPSSPDGHGVSTAEHMWPNSTITHRDGGSGAMTADADGNKEQAKLNPTETDSTTDIAADLTFESSCQSHNSFSSNPPEGQPESSQTQISTRATSSAEADSITPSISEQSFSSASQLTSTAYRKGDVYSVVGSLNPSRMGALLNGTSGFFSAGVQLLNVGNLQREVTTSQCPTSPMGAFHCKNIGWASGVEPERAEAPKPQPLQMEQLLNIRLGQVTSDPTQLPYDSLQTYEFEGRNSRAESLSSLESNEGEEGDSGDERRVEGGVEELNQMFQRLVQIIRDRQKEKDAQVCGGGEGGGEGRGDGGGESQKQGSNRENETQRWDCNKDGF